MMTDSGGISGPEDGNPGEETHSLPDISGWGSLPSGPSEIPQQVGPYKILEVLGEGGMGIVYLAEQTKPVHRRVALKIIKLGMNTEQVVARFETEREALALMNHPSVAKVYDAGVSADGRPYFVMEHVPGIAITEYCDHHRLATHDRLNLFIEVCHAVQHAHQKGIIHRDIKPSNVLVTTDSEKPIPTVIDFGVAKASQQRLTERTVFTEQGQLIGTPGYMSPEQAGMSALDVDTRTDVYSLGVLLYELLVGVRPFDDDTLRRAGFAEIQRIIREVDPPKPSTRLSGLSETSTTIAHKRGTEFGKLCRLVRSDLDWVVMKCLEKDRSRRYQTANSLADELGRYLRDEPVEARAPSPAYRLRKFVSRNRTTVSAGILVVAAMCAGLVMALVGMTQAQRSASLLRIERDKVQAESVKTSATLAYIKNVLRPGNLTPRSQFVDFLAVAESELVVIEQQPRVDSSVRGFLGTAFFAVGLDDKAQLLLRSAAVIHRKQGEEVDAARIEVDLADALYRNGKKDAAVALLNTCVQVYEKNAGATQDDLANALASLGAMFDPVTETAKADEYFSRAWKLLDETVSTQTRAKCLAGRGSVHYARGDITNAIRDYEKARSLVRVNNPDILGFTFSIAFLHHQAGDLDKADEVYHDAIATARERLGNDHPVLAEMLKYYGNYLTNTSRSTQAIVPVRESLDIQQRLGRGVLHPVYFSTVLSLLEIHRRAGAGLAEALERSKRFRHQVDQAFGPETEQGLRGLFEVVSTLDAMNDTTAATERLHREEWELFRKVHGENDWVTLASQQRLANCVFKRGHYQDAVDLCEDGLHRADQQKQGSAWLGPFERVYVAVLLKQGKVDEAEQRLTLFLLTYPDGAEHVHSVVCKILKYYEVAKDSAHAKTWRDRLSVAKLTCDP